MTCWKCQLPGASVPDPCCAAPDCDCALDFIHMACLSPARQREELRHLEEMGSG